MTWGESAAVAVAGLRWMGSWAGWSGGTMALSAVGSGRLAGKAAAQEIPHLFASRQCISICKVTPGARKTSKLGTHQVLLCIKNTYTVHEQL